MAKPKLSTKTPDSTDTNSLVDEHDALIAAPKERRFAIVELIVPEIVQHVGGDSIAKIQITHIEIVKPGANQDKVLSVMDAIYKARTGNKVRPGPEAEDTPLDFEAAGIDDSVE